MHIGYPIRINAGILAVLGRFDNAPEKSTDSGIGRSVVRAELGMAAFRISNFIIWRPENLLDDPENSGLAACHLLAPRTVAMDYDSVMPEGRHVVTVHFSHGRYHRMSIGGQVVIDGPLPEATICFMPSGQHVEAEVPAGFDLLQFFMPCAWFDGMAHRLSSAGRRSVELRRDGFACSDAVLLHLARAMVEMMRVADDAFRLAQFRTISEAFATRLISERLLVLDGPQTVPGGLAGGDLAKIRQFVEEHLDHPLQVEDLAAMARLSLFHFSRAFKLSTGQSPYHYVQQRRMARAYDLLQNAHLPVAAVAAVVGYDDPSHFAGVFRRTYGMSPRTLRRAG